MTNSYYSNFLENTRRMFDNNFITKYNYLSSLYSYVLPNNIKEIFKWVTFIAANVPKVQSALDKMSSIAITSINYYSDDLTELSMDSHNSWKKILEESLDIKVLLKEIAYNLMLYGNVFISVNYPIDRSFRCKVCGAVSHRQHFEKTNSKITTKLVDKEIIFTGVCPSCGMETVFEKKERLIKDVKKINVVLWPVHRMDIYEDEITGIKYYYYEPASENKYLLEKGNLDKIFSLPQEIIEASLKETKIKFYEDKILHIREKKFTAADTAWGLPKLTSAIADMISLLLLRKANERIYTDMILPLRALVPTQPDNAEPLYNHISADNIKSKIEALIKSWKKDPTAIKFFPIPLQPITMFGEGKALELSKEINAYADMILTSIGVPVEFIEGGLSFSGAGASLRVLQNQLLEVTNSLEKVGNFLVRKIAAFLDKEPVRIKLIPIKLIDDISDKQNMLALFQTGKVSANTALNFFDLNYKEEQKRLLEEAKDDIRRQMEIQAFQQSIATSLEDKIRQESMIQNSSAWNLNQQAIIQEADAYVQQLMQLDYGLRKSKLDELAKENPVLYAVVKWRMEFQERKQQTEAKHQNQQ